MNWGTGKASQRVNASIRHMHCEHSAYSNPTCALRAPFASHTFHSCFDLCRELKKIDFYQDRYSSADGVADLDSTVPDRSRRLRAAISADGASFNSFNQFNSVT